MTRDPCCTQKESGRLSCAPSAAPSSDSPPPGGHSAPCQPGLLGSERALPALWCCVLGWPRALRPQAGERQRGLRSPHLPSDSADESDCGYAWQSEFESGPKMGEGEN